MILSKRKHTLSQFILLWILGALFVILVFLNVLRYRATAHAQEAEAFMQAVRAEQEDRCALGRKYAVYQKHLKAFYKRKPGTHALHYDLSSGQGITARHKLFDYHLQMPSYADGRICCNDCEKLNRYYAPCEVLQKRKDFIEPEPECVVYVPTKGKGTAKKVPVAQAAPKPAVTLQPTEKSMAQTPQESAQTEPVTSAESELPQTDVQTVTPQTPQATDAQTEVTQSVNQTPVEESAAVPQETQTPAGETTDVPVADTPDVTAEQPKKTVAKTCKVPAQGEFFIDGCEVYQEDARGSVVHTWNFEKCAYENTQSCMVPAKWKRSTSTQEEKGLYPSDLDDYCTQLLKSAPCPAGAAAGRECGTADEVCYKDCQITDKTEVKESALIILYDVQVKTEQLRCMPAREVTVKIP